MATKEVIGISQLRSGSMMHKCKGDRHARMGRRIWIVAITRRVHGGDGGRWPVVVAVAPKSVRVVHRVHRPEKVGNFNFSSHHQLSAKPECALT